jgi:flagellar biosynthesis chaperone FliJ
MKTLKQHFDSAWRKFWGLPETHESHYEWKQEIEAVKEWLEQKRQYAEAYHMLQRKYACRWLLEELKP